MQKTLAEVAKCDREPIHIPGKIQNQGMLIVVNEIFQITHVSDNVEAKTGCKSSNVLGTSLQDFLKEAGIELKESKLLHLKEYITDYTANKSVCFDLLIQNEPHYIIAHKTGGLLVLEMEPCDMTSDNDRQRIIGVSVSKILEGKSLRTVLQNASEQIREIIQYDRVMIYKFWEDGHGEVVAEDKGEGVDSFFGLHYPASDIPKQARMLYKLNLTRLIADVNSTPSAILAFDTRATAEPLDLTHSVLRAVSPVHIQYLKNMGVNASFSVSLVINDQLWGLIACHNYTPNFIDYHAREGAKLIGQILSSSIQYRDEEETKAKLLTYNTASEAIISRIQKDWDITESLTKHTPNLLNVTSGSGAALIYENHITTLGQTPSHEEIYKIINWLKENNHGQPFHTDSLSKEFPEAAEYKDIASGLLACTLSKEMDEYILWFKPQYMRTVRWAGNPDAPMELTDQNTLKISPRRSFAAFGS